MRHNDAEMMSALCLQVSIVSQAPITWSALVCSSSAHLSLHSWWDLFIHIEHDQRWRKKLADYQLVMQVATLIAVYADWSFAKSERVRAGMGSCDLDIQRLVLWPPTTNQVCHTLHRQAKLARQQGMLMYAFLYTTHPVVSSTNCFCVYTKFGSNHILLFNFWSFEKQTAFVSKTDLTWRR